MRKQFTQSDGETLRNICEEICRVKCSTEEVVKLVHKLATFLAQFREGD